MEAQSAIRQLCDGSGIPFSRLKEQDLQVLWQYLEYCQDAESYMNDEDISYVRSKAYIAVSQDRGRRLGEWQKMNKEKTGNTNAKA